MTRTRTVPRAFALCSVALLLAVAALPAAEAQSQLNVRSVGELFVDAAGRVSGENVAAQVVEATGAVTGYASLALEAGVFEAVTIDGFTQAEKISGIGSSALTLKGTNAVLSLHDNINSVLTVQAKQATTVHFRLAKDVHAAADGTHKGVVDLYGKGGAYLGSIVAVGRDGAESKGETLAVVAGEVQAKAQAGSTIAFVGRPIYLASAAFHRATVEAAAEGRLAAHYVTEFDGQAVAASQVSYAAHVAAKSSASARADVETSVKSRAEAAAVLAYDLAYETLPARSPQEVAVFVNGQLAARVDAAAEVVAMAEAGIPAYYAQVENGRSAILAATPRFEGASEHKIAITASATARSEAQAHAQQSAEADSRAYGGFEHHANGKLTGDFLTSVLQEGRMELWSYTALASRAEVFKNVKLDGGAEGRIESVSDHELRIDGHKAALTMVDDAYATLMVEAKARSEASFDLAANVRATLEGDGVARLESAQGYVGSLVLAKRAESASHLRIDAEGRLSATLNAGESLVYRNVADGYASEDAVAHAIAEGKIGAQLLAGVQGSAVAATATELIAGVDAKAKAEARGAYRVDYRSQVETAQSFVMDLRGAALAAKSAADVQVLVNGAAAVRAPDVSAALAARGQATYYAETSLDGSLRLLVNTASAVGQSAHVTIESKVQAAARAAAKTDAFGSFKLFHDGSAVGDYVTLKTDQQAGAVTDFRMIATGEAVFDGIVAGQSAFLSGGADGATTLLLENKESKMELTDTTTGHVRIVAKQATQASFDLAAGVNAQARAENVVELTTQQGAHIGSMIITRAEGGVAAASRFETDVKGQVQAHLEQGAQILFKTHVGVEAELSAAQRTMINQAIASGQIAGQVLVNTQVAMSAKAHAAAEAALEATARVRESGESVAVVAAEAQGKVTATVTANYASDVQMLTAATKERVDITISSTSKVGKTIIVSLDPETVPGLATGDAEILFDGHAAAQADSYADILDANNDAGVAEYFVLAGEAGTQVLVSVPHFSVHQVTLKERDHDGSRLYMYATVFLAVLLVVETAVLVARRKN